MLRQKRGSWRCPLAEKPEARSNPSLGIGFEVFAFNPVTAPGASAS